MPAPVLADIREAARRIRPHVHRTPVFTCTSLDHWLGARILLKCENLQKVGAFKIRGATNAVCSLGDEEAARGVATHSSGNHGQALALAAHTRGIPAHVVMPHDVPEVKKAAVAGYGARVRYCEPSVRAREEALAELVAETGATVIHPYNDHRIIAGQGTAALELLEDHPDLDAIIAPVGGGGLLSGTAIAARALSPDIRILGAEPAGADDAIRSLAAGHIIPCAQPRTVADGLRGTLGSLTFPVLHEHVERILPAGEAAIIEAMRFVWERTKLIIEPSAAVPVAALRESPRTCAGLKVGIILSGGNVDPDHLPWSPENR
ncbi:pyridoxal-phosphate dependent enzyme [Thioalkalivibrio thiocyanodenitrificans]|uniref:pyridoxal-phosphate dependent enzyme n=1 Tax=Thioalkalivibrio thiocyanodenitrificans TaxID=243063 RepID=UPI00035E5AF5|nr:pyridoxal-phosphate dependent enzyme [Thioalkalivibrio thiocyanodenitrificans]